MMKSGSRSITVIGPGVRVEGTVTFNGYLRVQGDVLGDVTCTSENDGTVVVHKSGNLTGAVKAPHLVVSGHVTGPVNSSSTIEVNEGASVIGDAVYRQIDVHAGGVFNGLLTPTGTTGSEAESASPALQRPSTPPVNLDGQARAGGSRKIWVGGGLAALAVAAIAAAMLNGHSQTTVVAAPAGESIAAVAPTPPEESQPAAPAKVAPAAMPAATPAANAAPIEPKAPLPVLVSPVVPAKPAAPPAVAAVDAAKPPSDKVISVEGLNPDKPADAFFVSSRQSSVLYKRMRDDAGAGTRIDIRRGAKIRIPISGDEVFRVAEGGNIDVFYQGRKVSQRVVASGAWMSFVPLAAAAAAGAQ